MQPHASERPLSEAVENASKKGPTFDRIGPCRIGNFSHFGTAAVSVLDLGWLSAHVCPRIWWMTYHSYACFVCHIIEHMDFLACMSLRVSLQYIVYSTILYTYILYVMRAQSSHPRLPWSMKISDPLDEWDVHEVLLESSTALLVWTDVRLTYVAGRNSFRFTGISIW